MSKTMLLQSYQSKKGFVTLPNLSPETVDSFWQLVAGSGSTAIVMLSDIMAGDDVRQSLENLSIAFKIINILRIIDMQSVCIGTEPPVKRFAAYGGVLASVCG